MLVINYFLSFFVLIYTFFWYYTNLSTFFFYKKNFGMHKLKYSTLHMHICHIPYTLLFVLHEFFSPSSSHRHWPHRSLFVCLWPTRNQKPKIKKKTKTFIFWKLLFNHCMIKRQKQCRKAKRSGKHHEAVSYPHFVYTYRDTQQHNYL